MKKVAVVGAGMAGLTISYMLCDCFEVHLFDKQSKDSICNHHTWSDSIDLDTLDILGIPRPTKVLDRFYGDMVKSKDNPKGIFEPLKKIGSPRISVDRNNLQTYLMDKIEDKVILHDSIQKIRLKGNLKGSIDEIKVEGLIADGIDYDFSLVIDATGYSCAMRLQLDDEIAKPFAENDILSSYKGHYKITDKKVVNSFKNGGLLLHTKGYKWISLLDDDVLDVGCCILDPVKNSTRAIQEVDLMVSQMEEVVEKVGGGGEVDTPIRIRIA